MSDPVGLTGRDRQVHNFRYPPMPPLGFPSGEVLGLGGGEANKARDGALQQEQAAAIQAARKQGVLEGVAQAQAAGSLAIEQERSAVTAALEDFVRRRADYFRQVEKEAVRLALSIARKILHREAQMDPLLLAGVVRVALDQMQAGTHLVLRTSPDSAESWRRFCAPSNPSNLTIEVVPDSSIENHRCVLQAEVGSAEISLDSPLQEIESGFFDLLRTDVEAAP